MDIAEGKEDYIESSPELIARLKAEGCQKEIQKELDALRLRLNHKTAPDSLCHLEGQHLEDYLHDVKICQEFAVRNREIMAALILKKTGMCFRRGISPFSEKQFRIIGG